MVQIPLVGLIWELLARDMPIRHLPALVQTKVICLCQPYQGQPKQVTWFMQQTPLAHRTIINGLLVDLHKPLPHGKCNLAVRL